MKTTVRRFEHLDELRSAYDLRGRAVRSRLADFAAVPRSEYFYELAYCLLTPQSSAAHAHRAVEAIRAAGCWERPGETAAILRTPSSYIRFHHTKAKRLASAFAAYPSIDALLAHDRPPADTREHLVRTVDGLGLKEASHFLRNIGRRGLAILDRHILKNLHYHRAIRSIPRSLTTARYLAVERQFQRFADTVGIPMDELDLLFWSRETGTILK